MKDNRTLGNIFDEAFRQCEILEILKNKSVAIDELKRCIEEDKKFPALEEYNAFAGDENELTQEEYELLKEWLEK